MLIPGRLITWTNKGPLGMLARAYAYRRGDVVVWIDPVEPEARDRTVVDVFGRPHAIVLTSGGHVRDAVALRARYGCPIWVPGVEEGDRHLPDADERYTWQSALPAGMRAVHLPGVGLGEHAICGDIDGRRFAFVGDAVVNQEKRTLLSKLTHAQPRGEFQHPRLYLAGKKKTALKESKRLLSLELEMLFPTLGSPVLHDARGKLRESLSAWA
jgi:hypothetical protein